MNGERRCSLAPLGDMIVLDFTPDLKKRRHTFGIDP